MGQYGVIPEKTEQLLGQNTTRKKTKWHHYQSNSVLNVSKCGNLYHHWGRGLRRLGLLRILCDVITAVSKACESRRQHRGWRRDWLLVWRWVNYRPGRHGVTERRCSNIINVRERRRAAIRGVRCVAVKQGITAGLCKCQKVMKNASGWQELLLLGCFCSFSLVCSSTN